MNTFTVKTHMFCVKNTIIDYSLKLFLLVAKIFFLKTIKYVDSFNKVPIDAISKRDNSNVSSNFEY